MLADAIAPLLEAKADALVRRSAADLAALLHPGFVYVNAGGKRFDKAGYIDTYCGSGKVVFAAQSFGELEVTSFAGFAVATMTVRDRFEAGGETVAGFYRSMAVFAEVDGRWLWAAGQTMTAS